MPIALSPSVSVLEKDATNVIPAVSTSVGATIVDAAWGPVLDVTTVDSENVFVQKFGKPNVTNATSWFTAANFLSYSNNLLVVRTDTTEQRNAVSTLTKTVVSIPVTSGGTGYVTAGPGAAAITITAPSGVGGIQATATPVVVNGVITAITVTNPGTGYTNLPTAAVAVGSTNTVPAVIGTVVTNSAGVKINNEVDYTNNYANGEGIVGEWAAKYPGILGNSISVSMADAGGFSTWLYKDQFTSAPGTTSFAANAGASNDEMHIVVIDKNGQWTGTAGLILEVFPFVSKALNAKKEDGTSAYYVDIINKTSKYIWWTDHASNVATDSGLLNFGTQAAAGSYTMLIAPATGTITAAVNTAAVTGVSTTFNYTDVGSKLYSTSGTLIGTIESVESATALTLTSFSLSALTAESFKKSSALSIDLSGGLDHFVSTDGEKMIAFDLFNNDEQYDVNLLMCGKANTTVANYVIQNIAEVRKDCVVFVSPEDVSDASILIGNNSDITDKILAYRSAITSSSYAVIDSGYKYQYDKYNDKTRWIPLNGDVAGLCARADLSDDPWFSPAGFTRGQIKNVIKLAFSPRRVDRDNLYKAGVNPVVSFRGQGVVLYGDKTALAKPSAFDRINVRRLFIVLEKAIATASKYQLFEFNDGFTRAQFVGMVSPFLRDVRGRRGISDFLVVCDETNNTAEVIDSNRFVSDIYLKPNRSINFISLNFVATRTGISFTEIAGNVGA